ncbi:MAG TPA: orotidine-5'-phosphate decarboxylase [Prochlorococcaceae cyanobacterium Fu_MAG_134]|nr:orotidine-5'-phosphate decarboxylase [Prochlorococcaceae cyanobacterium Fu_MAG_134]
MTLPANPADQLIVALDGMECAEALALTSQLTGLCWVKVGLELFVTAGPEVVAELREQGLRIFLDLKFHDIPATMAGACRRAANLGAELITVHACAGSKALAEAQAAALEGAAAVGLPAPTLLAVTVLTSWDAKRLNDELEIRQSLQTRVERLAELAAKSGLGGCVCSPLELSGLRRLHPQPFELVTPGIRPQGTELGDQVRVMSPVEALNAGASRLVIGRPITRALDPAEAFARCCLELEQRQRD